MIPADAEEPAVRLVSLYRRVLATSMAGQPFLNPRLEVEAVGFRPWQGGWLGIVITPWFINLFLLPGADAGARSPGSRREVAFPAGRLKFLADRDEMAGEYESCPLLAPVREFADQAEARRVAWEALEALFVAPPAAAPSSPVAETSESRRNFLRRVVPGGS